MAKLGMAICYLISTRTLAYENVELLQVARNELDNANADDYYYDYYDFYHHSRAAHHQLSKSSESSTPLLPELIRGQIEAYNNMDADLMASYFHPDARFRNFNTENGTVDEGTSFEDTFPPAFQEMAEKRKKVEERPEGSSEDGDAELQIGHHEQLISMQCNQEQTTCMWMANWIGYYADGTSQVYNCMFIHTSKDGKILSQIYIGDNSVGDGNPLMA